MFRTSFSRCSTAVALATDLSTLPPGPARVDLSGSGGFLLSTDWSDLVLLGSVSSATGSLEQVLVRDLSVDPGRVFDAVATYWEGRYGFRAHVGFSESCLAVGRTCGDGAGLAGGASAVGVETWMYDIGGAVGLIDYRRGTPVWPYVFFGVGAVTYSLDRTVSPPLTFLERRSTPTASRQVVVTREPDELLIAIDELGIETRFALNFGVGTDFRLPLGPAGVGVRLELSDHIHRSPLDVLVTGIHRPTATGLDFGFVHNLRAAAGLVVQFGR